MKAIKFAQSQTNMNDWEYKAEKQQQKKSDKALRALKQGRKSMWKESD